MMSEGIREMKECVEEYRRELEKRVKETCIIVVLLGAGGRGLEKRREIRRKLEENGILALIPEDDFSPDVAPSVTEEAVLRRADVDLVFINVESWGSVTEFAQFHGEKLVAPKLRIVTFHEHHPLYGSSGSYLTDLYLTHLAVYGHIYAYGGEGSVFPDPERIILALSLRYRRLKALDKI